MTTETILLIFLIIIVIGALPTWPYSRSWGYAPMGVLAVMLVGFLIWAMAGERPLFRRSGNIESTVHEAGHDIKEMGRDVADSIRDTVN